jgi:hypothetical protein
MSELQQRMPKSAALKASNASLCYASLHGHAKQRDCAADDVQREVRRRLLKRYVASG